MNDHRETISSHNSGEWWGQDLIRELSTPIQPAAFLIVCHFLRWKFFISFCCLLSEGSERAYVLRVIFMFANLSFILEEPFYRL